MNYQEWSTLNPGKSINEFYKNFPAPITPSVPQQVVQPTYQNQNYEKESDTNLDIGNIIFSIFILLAFVLPWIDIQLFGLFELGVSNGFDLPEVLLNVVDQTTSMKVRVYSIYLIPFGAILSLFGETIKNELIRSIGQILAFCCMLLWIYVFYTIVKSINFEEYGFSFLEVMSYGFYLSIIGCTFYFYDVIIRMR